MCSLVFGRPFNHCATDLLFEKIWLESGSLFVVCEPVHVIPFFSITARKNMGPFSVALQWMLLCASAALRAALRDGSVSENLNLDEPSPFAEKVR